MPIKILGNEKYEMKWFLKFTADIELLRVKSLLLFLFQ